jgi:hypothetical protein
MVEVDGRNRAPEVREKDMVYAREVLHKFFPNLRDCDCEMEIWGDPKEVSLKKTFTNSVASYLRSNKKWKLLDFGLVDLEGVRDKLLTPGHQICHVIDLRIDELRRRDCEKTGKKFFSRVNNVINVDFGAKLSQ